MGCGKKLHYAKIILEHVMKSLSSSKQNLVGANSILVEAALGKDPLYLRLKSIVYKNDLQGFMRCCCSCCCYCSAAVVVLLVYPNLFSTIKLFVFRSSKQ